MDIVENDITNEINKQLVINELQKIKKSILERIYYIFYKPECIKYKYNYDIKNIENEIIKIRSYVSSIKLDTLNKVEKLEKLDTTYLRQLRLLLEWIESDLMRFYLSYNRFISYGHDIEDLKMNEDIIKQLSEKLNTYKLN